MTSALNKIFRGLAYVQKLEVAQVIGPKKIARALAEQCLSGYLQNGARPEDRGIRKAEERRETRLITLDMI